MGNVKISKDDAIKLLKQEEGHFFDYKSLAIDGKGIQKIAVAFANADGGECYIGILDEKEETVREKRWKGADKPEDFNGYLQALFEINPTLSVTYEALFSEGHPGYILRVSVDKSSEVHKTVAGKVAAKIIG